MIATDGKRVPCIRCGKQSEPNWRLCLPCFRDVVKASNLKVVATGVVANPPPAKAPGTVALDIRPKMVATGVVTNPSEKEQ